jgi:hypothetical protein
MSEATFDVFRGKPLGECVWLGSVDELDRAADLMKLIAARTPGDYFVFCAATQEVVAVIEAVDPIVKLKNSAAA